MTSLIQSPPEGFLFAGLGHRMLAFAVDCVPVLMVGYVASRWTGGLPAATSTVIVAALTVSLWVANRVVAVGFTGQSLGKFATGLTVAPVENVDGRVGVWRAARREALTLLLLVPGMFAGFVFLSGNPFVDPVGGGAVLWLAVALLLPLGALVWGSLRQCPVSDAPCRTVVLAD